MFNQCRLVKVLFVAPRGQLFVYLTVANFDIAFSSCILCVTLAPFALKTGCPGS